MREIHITIPPSKDHSVRPLGNWKMHRFHNFLPDGTVMVDIMTSEEYYGPFDEAVALAERRVDFLLGHGVVCPRFKVEVAAHHLTPGYVASKSEYWESHVEILGTPVKSDELHLFSEGVHSLKRHLTVRSRGCSRMDHVVRFNVAVSRLHKCHDSFPIGTPRHELVEYDSNPEHDAAWG